MPIHPAAAARTLRDHREAFRDFPVIRAAAVKNRARDLRECSAAGPASVTLTARPAAAESDDIAAGDLLAFS